MDRIPLDRAVKSSEPRTQTFWVRPQVGYGATMALGPRMMATGAPSLIWVEGCVGLHGHAVGRLPA